MPPPGANGLDLSPNPGDARLSPEMASFRALVLDFVRSYIARWGQSPSYGEIAAGTRSNRTRVKRALVSLERKGLLVRGGGVRGLSLPCDVEHALKTLERAGILPPVTKPTLLPPPALDYRPPVTDGHGEQPHDGNSGTHA